MKRKFIANRFLFSRSHFVFAIASLHEASARSPAAEQRPPVIVVQRKCNSGGADETPGCPSRIDGGRQWFPPNNHAQARSSDNRHPAHPSPRSFRQTQDMRPWLRASLYKFRPFKASLTLHGTYPVLQSTWLRPIAMSSAAWISAQIPLSMAFATTVRSFAFLNGKALKSYGDERLYEIRTDRL